MTRTWLTRDFWFDAGERAVKTAVQIALTGLIGRAGASLEDGFDVVSVDWSTIASYTAGGAILSILFSLASIPIGNHTTASAVPAKLLPPPPPN